MDKFKKWVYFSHWGVKNVQDTSGCPGDYLVYWHNCLAAEHGTTWRDTTVYLTSMMLM